MKKSFSYECLRHLFLLNSKIVHLFLFAGWQQLFWRKILLIQKQEISLHTPHPDPAKGGGFHKFPPPLMGGGEGEGDYANLLNSFAIFRSNRVVRILLLTIISLRVYQTLKL